MAFQKILEMHNAMDSFGFECEIDKSERVLKENCSENKLEGSCVNANLQQEAVGSSDSSGSRASQKIDLDASLLSVTYFIIDKLDECFFNAIRTIRAENVIGVSLEGNISRFGKLSCLNINVCDVVFIFDIVKLQLDGFCSGLQAILESVKIMKVMHDCRMASDCLFHCFSVTMVNVFDTQVADVMNHFEDQCKLPQFTSSLPCCLESHLNIPKTHFVTPSLIHLKKVTDSEWMQRPIPEQLLKRSVLNVMFLIDLRSSLLDKLLFKFNKGIEVFQTCVTDLKNNEEVEDMLDLMHKVPSSLDRVMTNSKTVTNVFDNAHPTFCFTRDVWCAK